MKLPLILSLLISGAISSKVINDNITNNVKQEISVHDNKKSNDILTAYIDGENKVYLNDINDSELVEDNWSPLESKLISVTVDVSRLDNYSRYIELEIPLGFELDTTPELLLDNNLIEVVRHPKQVVKIYLENRVDKDDMIRLKRDWQII